MITRLPSAAIFLACVAVLAGASLTPSRAMAGNHPRQNLGTTGHFTVTGRVVGDCTIDFNVPGALSFTYDPVKNTGSDSGNEHVAYYCTDGASITLSAEGVNSGSPFGASNGSGILNYDLWFKTTTLVCSFGSAPAGAVLMTAGAPYTLPTGIGTDQNVNFCVGPVSSPSQPHVAEGTYTDTVSVTFNAS
jgi:spore coat protein U-like protein